MSFSCSSRFIVFLCLTLVRLALAIADDEANSLNAENLLNANVTHTETANATNTFEKANTFTEETGRPRFVLTQPDEYVTRTQRQCFDTRSLMSCIKYKASKIVWKLATNGLGYFPNEYSRELREDKRRVRLIQLGEPTDVILFDDARNLQGDTELVHIIKFLKRSAETFGRNHGVQLALSSDSGAIISGSDVEARLHKKKQRKWLIILPLIILMKIAHLKMKVVTLLLGVLGLNVLLVGGTAWLIHYLKYKTLCKIHPHLVQSHSHVYDSDPAEPSAEYSHFVGSSYPASYYSSAGTGAHEIGLNSYSKDWASSKAYHGYNYLDTISKRVQ